MVGLDIGATKTAVRAATPSGTIVADAVVASTGWDAEPIPTAVAWILGVLGEVLPTGYGPSVVGIGAQGLDTAQAANELAVALLARGVLAVCVNDAQLLVPAAGLHRGIGVIAGTGAIAVGEDEGSNPIITGGWGWVLGDDAGAAGIVREATRSALLHHDDGHPDDGLLSALLIAFEAPSAERLARTVNDNPTPQHWGAAAPAVFQAADSGSLLARQVIDRAAAHLDRLVAQLVRRGVTGQAVVAAGSVITGQPRLFEAFRQRLARSNPELGLVLLTQPPVAGAVALARRSLRR